LVQPFLDYPAVTTAYIIASSGVDVAGDRKKEMT
jgi:hypothetical protein